MPKKTVHDKQLAVQLLDILNSTSPKKLIDFLTEKSEEERLALGPTVLKWIKERAAFMSLGRSRSDECKEVVRMIHLVALATLDVKSLRKGFGQDTEYLQFYREDSIRSALALRDRKFTDEFFTWYLSYEWRNTWPIYWVAQREGICSRIIDEPHVKTLLRFIDFPGDIWPESGMGIAEIFCKYPELLENELWFIFEHEFPKPFPFTGLDSKSYRDRLWNRSFLELVENGDVPRSRFLDATLKTLAFSYSDYEMRWYSDLHRNLLPSVDEIKEREKKYLELLGNRNPSSVALGFEMLVQLDKAGRLDDRLFLDGIAPIFNEKPKSRPKAAVGIIERIANRNKSLRNQAVHTAIPALSHEAVDVQTAAAKMILQYLDQKDNEIIAELQTIKPSLHGSVQALFRKLEQKESSSTTNESTTSVTIEITPRIFGPLDLPRLESLQKIKPVGSVDELIDLAAKVLATPSEVDEIEMLVDGISRLHHLRDDDFSRKTSALRKTLHESRLFRWAQNNFRFGKYLSFIVSVWLADSVTVNQEIRSVKFQLGERASSLMTTNRLFAESYFGNLQVGLAERIAQGIVLEPLSTPTHHGGWIDPMVLVERIKRDPQGLTRHDPLDKSLSLYRIAPDHQSTALDLLKNHLSGDPYVDALRAILGDTTLKVTEPHYFLAVQANKKITKRELVISVDLSMGSVSELQMTMPDRVVDKSLVPLFGLLSIHWNLPHYENTWVRAMLQWCGNLCPAIRAPFYWHSHSPLKSEIEDNYDYPGPDAFLEPLCDPNEPVTEAAATALLIALVAKPESLATLAQDIVIASIGDGRLAADTLSKAAAFWIRDKLPKRIRWIKRFQTVAVQSPGHADVVRGMLEIIVPDLDAKVLGGFLELLNECCIASGKSVSNPSCKTYLATLTGTGKAAKLAKKLLEL